ncbi:DNA alkylation response protein [Sulfolobus sp. E11-6]|uniref:DNA alkylation response protein n=1 Tax=Sulfolobus sp. E11-6 TaxID=2663020 RepID=UPI001295614B|nr:DNA alkylation response protein [Sulfolobus sp. E11-6]QGA69095.1 DNA alkylation response protein [Sulfolobus sp. E11-6]
MGKDNPFSYLSNAYGKNHFDVDKPLQRILDYFNVKADLSKLGDFAGRELYEIADHVDKRARPIHIMWSVNGKRVDEVWLDPSLRWAINRLIKDFDVNKFPYKEGNWHKHFASIYLISDPGIACILTITNQTAYALYKYGGDELKKYVSYLIGDADELLFGATWFTEVQGGSDLGANMVEAEFNGKYWVLNGNTKYFASGVGLADLALVSARPRGSKSGAKGLALFLVPKENSSGERNFLIRRLKRKSGTNSVPTGEVEFNNSESYLIGEKEYGIYYITEDLMVSRLANAVGALGIARKAFLESYYYSQLRKAFGKTLIEHPLIQKDLLEMEIMIDGGMILTFKAIEEFQRSWKAVPPYYSEEYHYARLLTHISKYITAEIASYVSRMAMEIHGGIGFLEEFPIERLHREALITPIWEGTGNIQALEMLETILKKEAHKQLLKDLERIVYETRDETASKTLEYIKDKFTALISFKEYEMQFYSKDILTNVGHGISVILLSHIGHKLGIERFIDISKIYYEKFIMGKEISRDYIPEIPKLIAIDEG